jgi:hypothetical protein
MANEAAQLGGPASATLIAWEWYLCFSPNAAGIAKYARRSGARVARVCEIQLAQAHDTSCYTVKHRAACDTLVLLCHTPIFI